MEAGAKGCEVVVSGKLRAARAKSMKFTDGFMIHSGQVSHCFYCSLVDLMMELERIGLLTSLISFKFKFNFFLPLKL